MQEPQKTLILSHSLRLQVPFDTIQKPHIIIERHENALWKTVSFSGGCFYVSILFSISYAVHACRSRLRSAASLASIPDILLW